MKNLNEKIDNTRYYVQTLGGDYGLCENGELEKNLRDGRYGDLEELAFFNSEKEAHKEADRLDVLDLEVVAF